MKTQIWWVCWLTAFEFPQKILTNTQIKNLNRNASGYEVDSWYEGWVIKFFLKTEAASYRNKPLQHCSTCLLLLLQSELCLAHQNTVTAVELDVGPPAIQQVQIHRSAHLRNKYQITLGLDSNALPYILTSCFLVVPKAWLFSPPSLSTKLCKSLEPLRLPWINLKKGEVLTQGLMFLPRWVALSTNSNSL